LLFDLSFGFKDSFRNEMEISLFSAGIYLARDCVNHVLSSVCPILSLEEAVTQTSAEQPDISSPTEIF
jgi:hypothetical protein